MRNPEKSILLRIYIGESDRYKNKPLYEYIFLKARELHLAGATVIRGILGFGADSKIHSATLLALTTDLPIIIEIADTQENIDRLLPFIDEAVTEGMVTMETINSIRYRHT